MIRAYITRDNVDQQGGWTITIHGHSGKETACAAFSALFHTFCAGIELLSKMHPKEIRVVHDYFTKTGIRRDFRFFPSNGILKTSVKEYKK